MSDLHEFRSANGQTFAADPRDLLAQLGEWLERRCGGLDGATSITTSHRIGTAIATLTVRHQSVETEPETLRDPAG